MDEKERILRKRVGKVHAVDTGKMDWRAYVDTGVNKPLELALEAKGEEGRHGLWGRRMSKSTITDDELPCG